MATPILAALWRVGALRGGMEHSGVVRGLLFPDQGSNPGSLHWECEVIATGPPGKSCKHFLKESTFISSLRDISQSPKANEQLSKYSLCTQASLVAQLVKNPPVMQETPVRLIIPLSTLEALILISHYFPKIIFLLFEVHVCISLERSVSRKHYIFLHV